MCLISALFGYYGLLWAPVDLYIAVAMMLALFNAVFAVCITITSKRKGMASIPAFLGFAGGQFFCLRMIFALVAWSVSGFSP